jgi:hypothetical protein
MADSADTVRRMVRRALLAAVALVLLACGGGADDDVAAPTTTSTAPTTTSTTERPTTTTTRPYESRVYDRANAWLCRPGNNEVCDTDLDTTVVRADGSKEVRPFTPAVDAPVDCFYVYPTVSNDPGMNSDRIESREERNVVRQQAARFQSVCTVYAPIYRQFTQTELAQWFTGVDAVGTGRNVAYTDVLDAWRHYVQHDNEGRGVILLGHSQGAMHLQRLLREEIDPDPDQRDLIVSAMLLGTSVYENELSHFDPCEAVFDTGCIISYSSFRDTAPPTETSLFGAPSRDGEPPICVNPAAMAGGAGLLDPYLSSFDPGVSVSTPFTTLPGLVSGECVERDGYRYMALTLHPDPGPRVDDIRGDVRPDWGMHAVDVNVALGDLVRVARGQASRYLAEH